MATIPPFVHSKLRTDEFSKFEVALSHVKMGPVTGIEVFKSARNMVIEVQVPSQHPGNSKSLVRVTLRTTIYSYNDHQSREAAQFEMTNSFLAIMSRSDHGLALEYSNLPELDFEKYKYRHDNLEIRSLGCVYHEELNNTHNNFFLS